MVDANITVFPRTQMPSKDFALLMEMLTSAQSGVIYGCGVSKLSDSEVHVDEGWAVVRGRTVKIEAGDHTMDTTADGTRYLTVSVDLRNGASPANIVDLNEIPADTSDFNVSDGQAYLRLADVTIANGAVSAVASSDKMEPIYRRSGRIHISDHAPTVLDGIDGDIWIKYQT